MDPDKPEVVLDGLQLIELQELREALPLGSIRELEEPESSEVYGDFGVSVVVILTVAAINALSVWLAKKRVESISEETVEYSVSPGRLRVVLHRRGTSYTSESPDANVIDALKTKLGEVASIAATQGINPAP